MKKFIIISLIYFLTLSIPSKAEDVHTFTFGIVPQQAASKLARLWNPIMIYWNKQLTGYKLQFKTAPNIPEFERRLAEGEYDIAYMNPYHYTVFHENPGYIAFAKEKDKRIKGIIVVSKDSPLKTIEELNGKTLAFPSPAAFAASALPRAYLKKQGIKITPEYVSSHDSVYLTVSRGRFPAGGGVMRTFKNTSTRTRKQLRILWETQTYTPHAIAHLPSVPKELIEQLSKVMFAMDEIFEGQRLLAAINFKGIISAEDKEWDDVRALEINLLDDLVK